MPSWLKTILFVALSFAAGAASATDTNAVINGWLQAQSELKTWQADFTQTRILKTLTQPLVTPGRISFAKPNLFRWELGSPAKTIAVRDEQTMLVIYPRLKQAERYPLTGSQAGMLGEALTLLDAGFPRDRASFDARFHVTSLAATNATWQLDLEPASPGTRRLIPLIQLTLATNDFTLLANAIHLPDGSIMRNDFTNSVLNPKLEPQTFKPELPADFKVTEPMKP
jgi:outer membrane lipoprotein-sorting protein